MINSSSKIVFMPEEEKRRSSLGSVAPLDGPAERVEQELKKGQLNTHSAGEDTIFDFKRENVEPQAIPINVRNSVRYSQNSHMNTTMSNLRSSLNESSHEQAMKHR